MRTTAKLLGMGLLLVTVTACGASGTGSAAPGTAAPSSTTPSTPAFPVPPSPTTSLPSTPPGPPQTKPTQGVPPADGAVGESQVDARTFPPDYPRTLLLADRGKTLILQAEEGGCRRIAAHLGEQTAQQVVVLVAVSSPPKGQMCPDYIKTISVPLALSAPLGNRKVVLRAG